MARDHSGTQVSAEDDEPIPDIVELKWFRSMDER